MLHKDAEITSMWLQKCRQPLDSRVYGMKTDHPPLKSLWRWRALVSAGAIIYKCNQY